MKKLAIKPVKKAVLKSSVKKASKPRKVRLSKNDPLYFSKMGKISAKKRDTPEWREKLAEWARKGHRTRDKSTYKGGRPKKSV